MEDGQAREGPSNGDLLVRIADIPGSKETPLRRSHRQLFASITLHGMDLMSSVWKPFESISNDERDSMSATFPSPHYDALFCHCH